MRYCLAYGRNLDLNRMKEKCPSCKLAGKAVLKDWTIAFKKYITLIPCKGGEVPVGVWEINEKAEQELDIIEGFPTMYRKEIVSIEFNGKIIDALVYLINDTKDKYPDKGYYARVLKGYADFSFDRKYLDDAVKNICGKSVYIFTKKKPVEYIKGFECVGVDCDWGIEIDKIKNFDGLLLPGGGDIDPKFYGQKNIYCNNIDCQFDEKSFEALKEAERLNKAIFGICLGMQYINVYFGGTLHQDIKNHKYTSHEIKVSNKIMIDYLGENVVVNSIHHQSVDKLGKNLEISAVSSDSIIEAISNINNKILAVQWHPERYLENGGKEIFEIFKCML